MQDWTFIKLLTTYRRSSSVVMKHTETLISINRFTSFIYLLATSTRESSPEKWDKYMQINNTKLKLKYIDT